MRPNRPGAGRSPTVGFARDTSNGGEHYRAGTRISTAPNSDKASAGGVKDQEGQGADGTDNIRVAVRVRPLSRREIGLGAEAVLHIQDGQASITDPDTGKRKAFSFDHVFDSTRPDSATQASVYAAIGRPTLESAMEGYNCTVFAYGQSGAGKSHTIMGGKAPDEQGIAPRLCKDLFQLADETNRAARTALSLRSSSTDRSGDAPGVNSALSPRRHRASTMLRRKSSFNSRKTASGYSDADRILIEMSFLEVYNERVRDLLNPAPEALHGDSSNLRVREHPSLGVYVQGLCKLLVSSYSEVQFLLAEGLRARHIAATSLNETSSRSHSILTLEVTQLDGGGADAGDEAVSEKVSKVNLIDLAGSERVKQSHAAGMRLKEGVQINKSLSTLMKCINTLSQAASGSKKRKKDKFVPFRDSTLTWLLKESLCGNAKTCMVAALSPADTHYESSLSTLRYADQAKQMQTRAVVNKDPRQRLVADLREEISRLRAQLSRAGPHAAPSPGLRVEGEQSERGGEVAAELQEVQGVLAEFEMSVAEKQRRTRRIASQRRSMLGPTSGGPSPLQMDPTDPLDAEHPFLVNLSEDALLSESLVYRLRPGRTLVLRADVETEDEGPLVETCDPTTEHALDTSGDGAPPAAEHKRKDYIIRLDGLGIAPFHCVFARSGKTCDAIACEGADIFVNGVRCSPGERVSLAHNARIVLGASHFFRFADPSVVAARRRSNKQEQEKQRAAKQRRASMAGPGALQPRQQIARAQRMRAATWALDGGADLPTLSEQSSPVDTAVPSSEATEARAQVPGSGRESDTSSSTGGGHERAHSPMPPPSTAPPMPPPSIDPPGPSPPPPLLVPRVQGDPGPVSPDQAQESEESGVEVTYEMAARELALGRLRGALESDSDASPSFQPRSRRGSAAATRSENVDGRASPVPGSSSLQSLSIPPASTRTDGGVGARLTSGATRSSESSVNGLAASVVGRWRAMRSQGALEEELVRAAKLVGEAEEIAKDLGVTMRFGVLLVAPVAGVRSLLASEIAAPGRTQVWVQATGPPSTETIRRARRRNRRARQRRGSPGDASSTTDEDRFTGLSTISGSSETQATLTSPSTATHLRPAASRRSHRRRTAAESAAAAAAPLPTPERYNPASRNTDAGILRASSSRDARSLDYKLALRRPRGRSEGEPSPSVSAASSPRRSMVRTSTVSGSVSGGEEARKEKDGDASRSHTHSEETSSEENSTSGTEWSSSMDSATGAALGDTEGTPRPDHGARRRLSAMKPKARKRRSRDRHSRFHPHGKERSAMSAPSSDRPGIMASNHAGVAGKEPDASPAQIMAASLPWQWPLDEFAAQVSCWRDVWLVRRATPAHESPSLPEDDEEALCSPMRPYNSQKRHSHVGPLARGMHAARGCADAMQMSEGAQSSIPDGRRRAHSSGDRTALPPTGLRRLDSRVALSVFARRRSRAVEAAAAAAAVEAHGRDEEARSPSTRAEDVTSSRTSVTLSPKRTNGPEAWAGASISGSSLSTQDTAVAVDDVTGLQLHSPSKLAEVRTINTSKHAAPDQPPFALPAAFRNRRRTVDCGKPSGPTRSPTASTAAAARQRRASFSVAAAGAAVRDARKRTSAKILPWLSTGCPMLPQRAHSLVMLAGSAAVAGFRVPKMGEPRSGQMSPLVPDAAYRRRAASVPMRATVLAPSKQDGSSGVQEAEAVRGALKSTTLCSHSESERVPARPSSAAPGVFIDSASSHQSASLAVEERVDADETPEHISATSPNPAPEPSVQDGAPADATTLASSPPEHFGAHPSGDALRSPDQDPASVARIGLGRLVTTGAIRAAASTPDDSVGEGRIDEDTVPMSGIPATSGLLTGSSAFGPQAPVSTPVTGTPVLGGGGASHGSWRSRQQSSEMTSITIAPPPDPYPAVAGEQGGAAISAILPSKALRRRKQRKLPVDGRSTRSMSGDAEPATVTLPAPGDVPEPRPRTRALGVAEVSVECPAVRVAEVGCQEEDGDGQSRPTSAVVEELDAVRKRLAEAEAGVSAAVAEADAAAKARVRALTRELARRFEAMSAERARQADEAVAAAKAEAAAARAEAEQRLQLLALRGAGGQEAAAVYTAALEAPLYLEQSTSARALTVGERGSGGEARAAEAVAAAVSRAVADAEAKERSRAAEARRAMLARIDRARKRAEVAESEAAAAEVARTEAAARAEAAEAAAVKLRAQERVLRQRAARAEEEAAGRAAAAARADAAEARAAALAEEAAVRTRAVQALSAAAARAEAVAARAAEGEAEANSRAAAVARALSTMEAADRLRAGRRQKLASGLAQAVGLWQARAAAEARAAAARAVERHAMAEEDTERLILLAARREAHARRTAAGAAAAEAARANPRWRGSRACEAPAMMLVTGGKAEGVGGRRQTVAVVPALRGSAAQEPARAGSPSAPASRGMVRRRSAHARMHLFPSVHEPFAAATGAANPPVRAPEGGGAAAAEPLSRSQSSASSDSTSRDDESDGEAVPVDEAVAVQGTQVGSGSEEARLPPHSPTQRRRALEALAGKLNIE